MLFPKRTKYNKQFKGLVKGVTNRGNKLIFGTYALKTQEEARLTSKQIEAGRRTIMKKIKRLGFLWVRVFPDIPVTSKPNEVRMGKGKGSVDYWAVRVKKGQIIYEISGISPDLAKKALLSGSQKLPVLTNFSTKGAYSLNG